MTSVQTHKCFKLLILSLVSILYFSCTKEKIDMQNEISTQQLSTNINNNPLPNNYQSREIISGISVSSFSFLKFNTTESYQNYLNFLTTSTHKEVKSFLADIGFEATGVMAYDSTYNSDTLTDAQFEDYLFNSNQFVEIDSTVIRKTDDGNFILTCKAGTFRILEFNNMLANIYDANKMNQLAINVKRDDYFDLTEFCGTTPSGYFENNNPVEYLGKRKLFGWGQIPVGPPIQVGNNLCADNLCIRFFVFGVGVSGPFDCQQGPAYNCNNNPL